MLTKTGLLVVGRNDGVTTACFVGAKDIDGRRLVVGEAESEGTLESVGERRVEIVEMGVESVGETVCPIEAGAAIGGMCQTHLLWTTK